MDNGYIFLFRSLMETSFYKNPKLTHLAVHLMMKAAWADHTINLSGKNHVLKRGQFVTGRNRLSEETGLSPQEIRTCIRTLEKDGFLTIKSTNKYSIITVSNYKKFQDYPNGNQPSNQPAINQQSTSNQPLTNTINKGNKREITVTPLVKNSKRLITDSFSITDEMQQWFINQGFKHIEIKAATAEFIDHWRGEGKMKKDWVATWRNGMRLKEQWAIKDGRSPIANQTATPTIYVKRYGDERNHVG